MVMVKVGLDICNTPLFVRRVYRVRCSFILRSISRLASRWAAESRLS